MARSAWDILSEDIAGMGFAGRIDFSGVRGGLNRPNIKRAGNFPYDKTDPDQTYGNPQTYDRGSNKGGALHKPLTPVDISDQDAERMGLKPKEAKLLKLTDEELDEVMGAPMLLTRGNSSDLGSSVPGSAGSWSKNPPKDWDQDPDFSKMDEKQLARIVAKLQIARPHMTRESPLQIDPRPPDIEQIPNQQPEYQIDQSDSDLEHRLANLEIAGGGHSTAPDEWKTGMGGRQTSRGLYGLMPKESAWDGLKNIFGSR